MWAHTLPSLPPRLFGQKLNTCCFKPCRTLSSMQNAGMEGRPASYGSDSTARHQETVLSFLSLPSTLPNFLAFCPLGTCVLLLLSEMCQRMWRTKVRDVSGLPGSGWTILEEPLSLNLRMKSWAALQGFQPSEKRQSWYYSMFRVFLKSWCEMTVWSHSRLCCWV